MTVLRAICVLAPLLLAATALSRAASSSSSGIEYDRDVRPILSENCFPCHGADSAARKAKLRLDDPGSATSRREDHEPAIIPGKPDASELVRRIFDQGDDVMPPEKSHKTLTPQQKDLLKRWIAAGAKYQPHWAFIAPVRPSPPKVANKRWVRNPVDQFILARLEQENLQPNPEPDRRTLARRASLDLIGLPPKVEEVESFVQDRSPDAYEKYVDRLLASPRWGEHRGRYWLDVARYADTHGIHFDNFREMWTYRDWVIGAFNTNMPFDQFTREQLAGDLLPNATLEQKIASGFNRCNITTSEGGAIDEEYLVLYTRDRTETTSQVWMGMTAGCAVCHDHKYDPLSQKEFYAMSAFFNNTTQRGMDGNIKDTPPILVVTKPEDRARWEQLQQEVPAAEKSVAKRKESARKDFDAWLAQPDHSDACQPKLKDALLFRASLSDGSNASVNVEVAGEQRVVTLATNAAWQDGAVAEKAYTVRDETAPALPDIGDFERTNSFSYAAWIKLGDSRDGAVFARMDEDKGYRGWDCWIEKGRPGVHLIHSWTDNALKVVARKELPKGRWSHVCVTYDGSSKADGIKIYVNGELQDGEVQVDRLNESIRSATPFKIGRRKKSSQMAGTGLQDLRIFSCVLKPEEIRELGNSARLNWLASKPADSRTKEETDELYPLWLGSVDTVFQEARDSMNRLKSEEGRIRERGTVAHVMNEKDASPEAYLLSRGEYDKRRDKLTPATPQILPPMSPDLPRNRLGFADWLLSPQHPLAARVTVNRFWQELFGMGLVRSAGDFGVAGEMPSHPELLDWLAVQFRESGWNVKGFYRLLVTSATYRQSAMLTPEKLAKDPQNRLLARGPRFRMDAEMIRDCALASSGLLVAKIGGPSVKPYQPDGVWEAVAMPESNTRKYARDSGESLYRRSLYTFWKRSAPPATMEILNAPSRETCTVRRERTDTPLQALVTLNDPQFVEAARRLAERTLKDGDRPQAARIDFMARRLISRPLNAKEQQIVEAGLNDLLAHYRQSPDDAAALIKVGESKADPALDKPTLAAYTMVANQLMNLDEVLNK